MAREEPQNDRYGRQDDQDDGDGDDKRLFAAQLHLCDGFCSQKKERVLYRIKKKESNDIIPKQGVIESNHEADIIIRSSSQKKHPLESESILQD